MAEPSERRPSGQVVPFPGTAREALENALKENLGGVVILGICADRKKAYRAWADLNDWELCVLKEIMSEIVRERRSDREWE